jgi:phosphate transport system permease protein
MSTLLLIAVVLVLAIAAFVLARARALASAGGDPRALHSLPAAYGWHGALMVLLPAFAVLLIWLVAQPIVICRLSRRVAPDGCPPPCRRRGRGRDIGSDP